LTFGFKEKELYTHLAPIYDSVMSHVDYSEWATLIQNVLDRYSHRDKTSIFEIGGGTGVLGRQLVTEGYSYQGSDLSFTMCAEARKYGHHYFVADGCNLALKRTYDMVLFLYDGINYLQTPRQYSQLFSSVWNILDERGLFLFDITTIKNSLRYFNETLDFDSINGCTYIRHSHFDPDTQQQHNDFVIFKQVNGNPGLYTKGIENHSQKVLPVKQILSFIPRELFTVLGVWDGYTMQPYKKHSDRIHFLLQKKEGV
jgi:hypothetical protein